MLLQLQGHSSSGNPEKVGDFDSCEENTVKPFFSRALYFAISQARQVRKNNGLQKFEYSSVSV